MLTTSFFEMGPDRLADFFTDSQEQSIVWTVRGINTRFGNWQGKPVFSPDFTPWLLARDVGAPLYDYTRIVDEDMRGWIDKTLKAADVTTSWPTYIQKSGAGRDSYENVLGRWWYWSPLSGLVTTQPYSIGESTVLVDVPLDEGETRHMYTGTFGSVRDTAVSWFWPYMLHWTNQDEGLVGYYESMAAILTNKRIVVKVGRFFAKLGMDSRQCERIVEALKSTSKSYGGEVKFAVTADDIAKLYRTGPDSCMTWRKIQPKSESVATRSKNKINPESLNPVRAYAYPLDRTEIVPESGNTIGFAYLGDLDKGTISARCIVNFATKSFGRSYGSPSIENKLMRLGWNSRDSFSMEGQVLSRIGVEELVFFPYIDDGWCNGLVYNDGRIKLCTDYDISTKFDKRTTDQLREYNIAGKVLRNAAGYQMMEVRINCADCGRNISTRSGIHRRHPDNAVICNACIETKYVHAVLALQNSGQSEQVYVTKDLTTRIDDVHIVTAYLDNVTTICTECGTRTLNHRISHQFGGSLCRPCARAQDLRQNYMRMYYYDYETGGLGQSTFRVNDGVTVHGFDLPVHIVSLGRLATRCPDCRVVYRTGTEHECDNQ